MTSTSRLHIPKPPARPGDEPNFDYLEITPAGEMDRPATDVRAREIEHLNQGMVRVLNDSGDAVGPWAPQLELADLQVAMRHMLLTRAYDNHMLRMHRQGKITFYMQSTGEEAVAVASAMALSPSDMLFPSYRTQGLHISRGRNLVDLMCQCLSNSKDMCKGRQMPIMYHWARGNIFSISGNLTTQFPQAVGWAMGSAIKGDDAIAAAWIGEGSSAEADFHHALTFASVYRAPVILNVVNNQWAISTFQGVAGGERRSFAARGPGYGVPGIRVDGNDFLAVHAAVGWAAHRARHSHGPTLLEMVTYRAAAHSTSDDPSRYRPKNEAAAWPLGDPIERLQQHLTNAGWTDADQSQLTEEVETQVTESWEEALTYGTLTSGPKLDRNELFEDVYKDIPKALIDQRNQMLELDD